MVSDYNSLISAVNDPIDLYTVTPKSTFDPDLPAVYWQLAVEAPAASANLVTTARASATPRSWAATLGCRTSSRRRSM